MSDHKLEMMMSPVLFCSSAFFGQTLVHFPHCMQRTFSRQMPMSDIYLIAEVGQTIVQAKELVEQPEQSLSREVLFLFSDLFKLFLSR